VYARCVEKRVMTHSIPIMTDGNHLRRRRSSNDSNIMLPSAGTSTLLATTDNAPMGEFYSSTGMLSGLSKEDQDVLASDHLSRRFSDVSFSRLMARRLSGCSNGLSNFYASSGLTMADMMSATESAPVQRFAAERRLSSLSLQDSMCDYKLTSTENTNSRRRSSLSLDMGEHNQIPHHIQRRSLELAVNGGRRSSSFSQQSSDFSQTSQQKILEMVVREKSKQRNSLDLLGDVAALASSNAPISPGLNAKNAGRGVGLVPNRSASAISDRTSLDILGEASRALSSSDQRRASSLSQQLLDSYDRNDSNCPNDLLDDISPATLAELGINPRMLHSTKIQQELRNRATLLANHSHLSLIDASAAIKSPYDLERDQKRAKQIYEANQGQSNNFNGHKSLQNASNITGGEVRVSGEMASCKESLTMGRLSMSQSSGILANGGPLLEVFHQSMQNSQISQKNIQLWDRKMGLKRSHSATMTKTTQSRKRLKLFFGKMLGYSTGTSDEMEGGHKPSKTRKKR